jgi:tRNA wybutosine-synthesizing protein 1
VPGSGDPLESDEEEDELVSEEIQDDSVQKFPMKRRKDRPQAVSDLEDIRFKGSSDDQTTSSITPLAIDFTTYKVPSQAQPILKEMAPKTSPTYAAFTKQGYTIVGSHSGIKIYR